MRNSKPARKECAKSDNNSDQPQDAAIVPPKADEVSNLDLTEKEARDILIERAGIAARTYDGRIMVSAAAVAELLGQAEARAGNLLYMARRILRQAATIEFEPEIEGILDALGALVNDLGSARIQASAGRLSPLKDGYLAKDEELDEEAESRTVRISLELLNAHGLI